mgnify:CR=1 FL=1
MPKQIENNTNVIKTLLDEARFFRGLLEGRLTQPFSGGPNEFKTQPQRAQPIKCVTGSVAVSHRPVSPSTAPTAGEISGGLKRMMIALAQRPELTKKQIGVRAGLSSSSGMPCRVFALTRTTSVSPPK